MLLLSISCCGAHPYLHSFPTRRSSDLALFRWVDAVDAIERALAELGEADEELAARLEGELVVCGLHDARRASRVGPALERDRKSTRLNSSHMSISYAVFCLKKKKKSKL